MNEEYLIKTLKVLNPKELIPGCIRCPFMDFRGGPIEDILSLTIETFCSMLCRIMFTATKHRGCPCNFYNEDIVANRFWAYMYIHTGMTKPKEKK